MKIIKHGVQYSENALFNWIKRRERLIDAWVLANRNNLQVANLLFQTKCPPIIEELDRRISSLRQEIYDSKLAFTRHEQDLQHTFIHIKCQNFDCSFSPDATITAVRYKDYKPGKFKCEKCGNNLESDEEMQADELMHTIKFNAR